MTDKNKPEILDDVDLDAVQGAGDQVGYPDIETEGGGNVAAGGKAEGSTSSSSGGGGGVMSAATTSSNKSTSMSSKVKASGSSAVSLLDTATKSYR